MLYLEISEVRGGGEVNFVDIWLANVQGGWSLKVLYTSTSHNPFQNDLQAQCPFLHFLQSPPVPLSLAVETDEGMFL